MAPSCLLLDESLLRITSPEDGAVVSTSVLQVEVSFPPNANGESLSVSLDGRCITDMFEPGTTAGMAVATLNDLSKGFHKLTARIMTGTEGLDGIQIDATRFDIDTVTFRAEVPPAVDVTLNEIPDSMNGSRTARSNAGTAYDTSDDYDRVYRLMTPETGFTIELTFEDGAPWSIDPTSLVITSARPLGGGAIEAGENLAPFFDCSRQGATWKVPGETAFPVGPNLIRASIARANGVRSDELTYRFDVHPLEDYLNPFLERDYWLLLFDRDDWTTTWYRRSQWGGLIISSVQKPNDVADFDEAMEIAGFRSGESGRGAATVRRGNLVGTNAIMRAMLVDEIQGKLREFYHVGRDGALTEDSVNIDFILPTDPGAPDPADFSEYGDFSVICIGGDHPVLYGCAELDPNNQRANGLTDVDEGVFVTNALRAVVNSPVAWIVLGPLMPGIGTPVGESDLDALILSDGYCRATSVRWFANRRYDDLMLAVDLTTRAIASAAAHEIGHSVGLVANGFPPHGLFGGESAAEFAGPRTNSHHLDTPGNNLMAAGVHGAQSGEMIDLEQSFFNEMNLAYLRGRLVYRSDLEPSPFEESAEIDLSPEEQVGTMHLPDTSVEYTITVTNKTDLVNPVVLDVEFIKPISLMLFAELDRTEIELGPHESETVTLTFRREQDVRITAYDVRVTGYSGVELGQTDTVLILTFIAPETPS